MGERVSGNKLASILGITETSVRKHVKNGLYRRGADGLFDVDQCREAWKALRDPDAVIKGGATQSGAFSLSDSALVRARTAQAAIKAKQAEIELARTKGEIIDRRDAQRAALAVVHELKQRFDGLPAAAAPVVHAAPTVAEAEALLRGMVRAVLVEVAKLGDIYDDVSLPRQ